MDLHIHRWKAGSLIPLAFLAAVALSGPASARQFNPSAMGPMTPINQEVLPVVGRAINYGAVNPAQPMHVAVSMSFPRPGEAEAFVDSVSNPNSPNYRQFISPEEFGKRFGRSQAQVDAVKNYLISKGLTITMVGKNRLTILATGTAGQMESAFGTTFNNYSATPTNKWEPPVFFANETTFKVPASIQPYILSINGLENFTRPKPRATTTLIPKLVWGLYNTKPILDGGYHGEGRVVAVSNYDGFSLKDATSFITTFGLPVPTAGAGSNISVITIDGGSQSNPPGGEGDLDIQMEIGTAPLVDQELIYDGGFGGGLPLIDVLNQEAQDNTADIISESYGWNIDGATATACHNVRVQMSAQGITYLVASGDSGTQLEPYSYPNYDTEVLMVGGTIATVDSNTGIRIAENAWNGSGGGWSTAAVPFNTLPSWQVGNGVPTGINFRLNPDVSLHAAGDNAGFIGAYDFFSGGAEVSGDGTSFASPTYAGCLTVTTQKLIALGGLPADGNGKRRFGRINDFIYSQNQRSDVWTDITDGDTGALPNGNEAVGHAGWDFCTGWGVPDFDAFAQSVLPRITTLTPSTANAGGPAFTLNVAGQNFTASSVVKWKGSARPTIFVSKSLLKATIAASDISNPGSATVAVASPGGGISNTATFQIVNSWNGSLINFTANPTTVVGGQSTTATVTISPAAQQGGQTVVIYSNSSVILPPPSVTVPEGQTTVSFNVDTAAVAQTAVRILSATLGNVTKNINITLNPGDAVQSLTVNPTQVVGGSSTVGTVSLAKKAGAGGVKVNLSSNSGVIQVPASVTVPAGSQSVNFTATTSRVGDIYTRVITATVGATSRSANLTLTPGLRGISLNPTSVVGGTSTTGTVTLLGPAPAGGQSVLITSGSSIIQVPGIVVVPAGATSVTFSVGTVAVTQTYIRPVTANLAGVSLSAYLTVHP